MTSYSLTEKMSYTQSLVKTDHHLVLEKPGVIRENRQTTADTAYVSRDYVESTEAEICSGKK